MVAALLLAGCSAPGAPRAASTPDARPARLIAVGGPVEVVAGKQRTAARLGQQLPVAAQLVSAAGGSATVALPDGASVTIAGVSTYHYAVAGGEATGQVDAVASRGRALDLHVPLAEVRGRGALHFHAGSAGTPPATTVSVFEGTVEVRFDGGSQEVLSGQRLVLRPAGPGQAGDQPAVQPIPSPR